MFPRISKVKIYQPATAKAPFYVQIFRGKWSQYHDWPKVASVARIKRIPWMLGGKVIIHENSVTWEREDGS